MTTVILTRCIDLFVGAAQGLITGIRGLCNGLGPAVFGCIFYLFGVDLNEENGTKSANTSHVHDAFRVSQTFIFICT